MQSEMYPLYKASGMSYIDFARTETELFKLLFMRDRTTEIISDDHSDIAPFLEYIQNHLQVDEQTALDFHVEMWVFVHGIATMTATGYLTLDNDAISKMLSDIYQGLCLKYEREKNK